MHCIFTPVLFALQGLSSGYGAELLTWWKNLDIFFLTLSFFAIYRSTRLSNNGLIKYALWISWVILFFLIINEKISWLPIAELTVYITTSSLIFFHIYNLNYCQCKSEECCSPKSDKKSNWINNWIHLFSKIIFKFKIELI